jgi:hypothetical protein
MRQGTRHEHRARAASLLVAALCIGCEGGPGATGWHQPLTLTWDQPDDLAEYYHVRSGLQLVRVDGRAATLYLPTGTHTVQVEACNQAGCSAPTPVVVTWRDGRWVAGQ